MISGDKFYNGLRALHHILVMTRQMAYDEASHTEMADVLDIAEYLPRLLADEKDRTTEFRANLLDLSQRWPQFARAVDYFDEPSPPRPW